MYPVLKSTGDAEVNSVVRSIVFPLFFSMRRFACVHAATVAPKQIENIRRFIQPWLAWPLGYTLT